MTAKAKRTKMTGDFEGYCPDPYCNALFFFEASGNSSQMIDCYFCGQTFPASKINKLKQPTAIAADELISMTKNLPSRISTEWIRINGISSYYCKAVSHLFTEFGVGLNANQPPRPMDCNELYDCAFSIEEGDLLIQGYGEDVRYSKCYLAETFTKIFEQNNSVEVLVPLSVPGDGSCLVHALSRALVGREFYWHILRESLTKNLTENEAKYKELLGGFIAEEDWGEIVRECDPSYAPLDDRMGLRNVHIFVLANVLHRPIILLDNPKNMAIAADFSAVFLPLLYTVDQCKQSGILNKPLVIAWASTVHGHFIPLVKIEGRPVPKFAKSFLPKAWCTSEDQKERYISFTDSYCTVACGRIIPKSYARNVFDYTDRKFSRKYGVCAQVLCDFNEIFGRSFSQKRLADSVVQCLDHTNNYLLHRCLMCWRLVSFPSNSEENFGPNNDTYKNIVATCRNWKSGRLCETLNGSFRYDRNHNCFRLVQLYVCPFCGVRKKQLRLQLADGTILYQDGDHTRIPAPAANCKRKMKHFLRGELYDNLPGWFAHGRTCTDRLWHFEEDDYTCSRTVHKTATKRITTNR